MYTRCLASSSSSSIGLSKFASESEYSLADDFIFRSAFSEATVSRQSSTKATSRQVSDATSNFGDQVDGNVPWWWAFGHGDSPSLMDDEGNVMERDDNGNAIERDEGNAKEQWEREAPEAPAEAGPPFESLISCDSMELPAELSPTQERATQTSSANQQPGENGDESGQEVGLLGLNWDRAIQSTSISSQIGREVKAASEEYSLEKRPAIDYHSVAGRSTRSKGNQSSTYTGTNSVSAKSTCSKGNQSRIGSYVGMEVFLEEASTIAGGGSISSKVKPRQSGKKKGLIGRFLRMKPGLSAIPEDGVVGKSKTSFNMLKKRKAMESTPDEIPHLSVHEPLTSIASLLTNEEEIEKNEVTSQELAMNDALDTDLLVQNNSMSEHPRAQSLLTRTVLGDQMADVDEVEIRLRPTISCIDTSDDGSHLKPTSSSVQASSIKSCMNMGGDASHLKPTTISSVGALSIKSRIDLGEVEIHRKPIISSVKAASSQIVSGEDEIGLKPTISSVNGASSTISGNSSIVRESQNDQLSPEGYIQVNPDAVNAQTDDASVKSSAVHGKSSKDANGETSSSPGAQLALAFEAQMSSSSGELKDDSNMNITSFVAESKRLGSLYVCYKSSAELSPTQVQATQTSSANEKPGANDDNSLVLPRLFGLSLFSRNESEIMTKGDKASDGEMCPPQDKEVSLEQISNQELSQSSKKVEGLNHSMTVGEHSIPSKISFEDQDQPTAAPITSLELPGDDTPTELSPTQVQATQTSSANDQFQLGHRLFGLSLFSRNKSEIAKKEDKASDGEMCPPQDKEVSLEQIIISNQELSQSSKKVEGLNHSMTVGEHSIPSKISFEAQDHPTADLIASPEKVASLKDVHDQLVSPTERSSAYASKEADRLMLSFDSTVNSYDSFDIEEHSNGFNYFMCRQAVCRDERTTGTNNDGNRKNESSSDSKGNWFGLSLKQQTNEPAGELDCENDGEDAQNGKLAYTSDKTTANDASTKTVCLAGCLMTSCAAVEQCIEQDGFDDLLQDSMRARPTTKIRTRKKKKTTTPKHRPLQHKQKKETLSPINEETPDSPLATSRVDRYEISPVVEQHEMLDKDPFVDIPSTPVGKKKTFFGMFRRKKKTKTKGKQDVLTLIKSDTFMNDIMKEIRLDIQQTNPITKSDLPKELSDMLERQIAEEAVKLNEVSPQI